LPAEPLPGDVFRHARIDIWRRWVAELGRHTALKSYVHDLRRGDPSSRTNPESNMKRISILAGVLLAALTLWTERRPSPDTPARQKADSIWQLTYLKAFPEQRHRLERFITLNWFGPDETARRKGYIDGFLLLRGSAADTTWDLLVIDVFADSTAQVRARERYRSEILPAHERQLVDGLDFPELGRIVGERTTRPVSGNVSGIRLGL
jgi:hypothetical protein